MIGRAAERGGMGMGGRDGKRRSESQAAVPLLTAPASRDLFGGLYSAKLLFEFAVVVEGRPGARRLCEERLVLIEAANAKAAVREAKRQGCAAQYRYRNSDRNPVLFRFVGLLDLVHLGIECQPNEVWYDITQRMRPMERRRAILPLEKDLSAVKNERLTVGGPGRATVR
jgi:Domain of unknown function (DUF4288)